MAGNTYNNNQQNKNLLSIVGLLDEAQPYNEINRLRDGELPGVEVSNNLLSRIQGSLVGLAVGDALGASVEFRPHAYMEQFPVTDMQGGGTWGLQAGQWTDDTSMALCLAASLIAKNGFNGYDQLVRYKRWYKEGYMSSTGTCFDIGSSTRQSIVEFEKRQRQYAQQLGTTIPEQALDKTIGENLTRFNFNVQCGAESAAGNGPLMRLAPIPLFFFRSETDAIENAGKSASLTHGDKKAIDACRFYAALIWNAIQGTSKAELLDSNFYRNRFKPALHDDVLKIAKGSYKNKNGYADGIRGKGFILNSLEAALWAFDKDDNSFHNGVLLAVNLGDDTDTTAAIYGQLAGAVYGIEKIPHQWREQLFQADFLITLANGLYSKGKDLNRQKRKSEAVDEMEVDKRPIKARHPSTRSRRPQIIAESN